MPHSDPSPSPPCDAFASLPPFPDNIPTAPLLRISLEKLLRHDPDEEERCWKACCELGFFYLDLRTSDGQSIDGEALLQDAERLFDVMKGFYDLDIAEKIKYDLKDQGSYFGYKGYGEGIIDKQGTRDKNEFYNVTLTSHLLSPFHIYQLTTNPDLKRRHPLPLPSPPLPFSLTISPPPLRLIRPLLARPLHPHPLPPLLAPTHESRPALPTRPHRALRRPNPLRQSPATTALARRRRARRTHGFRQRHGAVQ